MVVIKKEPRLRKCGFSNGQTISASYKHTKSTLSDGFPGVTGTVLRDVSKSDISELRGLKSKASVQFQRETPNEKNTSSRKLGELILF